MEIARAPSEGPGDLNHKVLTAFQRFDLDGSGYINRQELKKVMQELDPILWSDRRVGRLLHAIDKNRDGRISYQEFVQWACSEDSNPDMAAFREAVRISQEEAFSAPRKLAPRSLPLAVQRPRRAMSRPRSAPWPAPSSGRGSAPRASSGSRRPGRRKTVGAGYTESPALCPKVELGRPLKLPEILLDARGTPPEPVDALLPDAALSRTAVHAEMPDEPAPSERLIIFDYDGTITVDKDEKFKGLMGPRLCRLKDMMTKIRASTARCILVTAQFPMATQDITIPALEKTGLLGLFEDESLDSRLSLYWDDADHGTIYNGAKVMMGKIDLISEIINGKNCWKRLFAPSNVIFVDDVVRNFQGYEKIGINIHKVAQDGMLPEDMEVVEAFAEGSKLKLHKTLVESAAHLKAEDARLLEISTRLGHGPAACSR